MTPSEERADATDERARRSSEVDGGERDGAEAAAIAADDAALPSTLADEGFERLHPLSPLFAIGRVARQWFLPLILVLFFARGIPSWIYWVAVPTIAFAVGGGILDYFRTRYRLGEDELVVEEGLLSRNRRHIPYARIQNVEATQSLMHRWLGVAEVRVETAGGEGAEAKLSVLTLEAVEAIKRRVRPARAAGADADGDAVEGAELGAVTDPAGRTVVALGPGDLVFFGLTRNRSLQLLAAGFALLWELGQAFAGDSLFGLNLDVLRLAELSGLARSTLLLPGLVLAALGTAIVVIALLSAVSVAWAVVQLYGFTVTRDGEDLHSAFGLFTRHSATTPRHRIQSLAAVTTPILRRAQHLVLSAETAGGEGGGESVTSRQWIAPGLPEADLVGVLAEVQPGVAAAPPAWRPPAAGAQGRILRRALFWIVPLALVLAATLRLWSLPLILPLLVGAVLHARLSARHLGWARDEEALYLRHGYWRQRRVVLRYAKMQNVTLLESPFDRRAGMATLEVDTAGRSNADHRVRLPYLAADEAEALRAALARRAAETVFRW